jgi:hypothetical protein
MIRFEYELVEKHKLFEGIELIPLETYEGMDTELVRELKTPHGYRVLQALPRQGGFES